MTASSSFFSCGLTGYEDWFQQISKFRLEKNQLFKSMEIVATQQAVTYFLPKLFPQQCWECLGIESYLPVMGNMLWKR